MGTLTGLFTVFGLLGTVVSLIGLAIVWARKKGKEILAAELFRFPHSSDCRSSYTDRHGKGESRSSEIYNRRKGGYKLPGNAAYGLWSSCRHRKDAI